MKILKGILSDSKEYYLNVKREIEKKLSKLPKGSIKERKLSGKRYYYLQQRIDKKVVHKYLGKNKPDEISRQIKIRRSLEIELKKVNEALMILKRSEGRKRD